MKNSPASHIAFLLFGAGIGSLVGILCAPKSGEETCQLLVEKAKHGQEYVRTRINELEKTSKNFITGRTQMVARRTRAVAAALQSGLETYQKGAQQYH